MIGYYKIINIQSNSTSQSSKKKLLAILLDPDKIVWNTLDTLISKIINHLHPYFYWRKPCEK
jgi:hypothetical protein